VKNCMGEYAKSLRQANGWTLQEAANRIGITKSHLWEFEDGRSRNPTLKMIGGLARCYGLSMTDFVALEKPHYAAETMAALAEVERAVEAAYRRGVRDGIAMKAEAQTKKRAGC